MSFCICLQNFVQIGPSATDLWRHIHVSRWRPSAILNFLKGNCRSPTKCKWGSQPLRSVLKFWLDRIYSFGDIAIFALRFWLEIAYLRGCIRPYAQNQGLIYFRGWTPILISRVDLPINRPTSKGVAGGFRCVYWWSPHVKARFGAKFSKSRRKSTDFTFLAKWGEYVTFSFRDPKGHILARNDVFWPVDRQNRRNGLGVENWKNLKKLAEWTFDRQGNLPYPGAKYRNRIIMQFCTG